MCWRNREKLPWCEVWPHYSIAYSIMKFRWLFQCTKWEYSNSVKSCGNHTDLLKTMFKEFKWIISGHKLMDWQSWDETPRFLTSVLIFFVISTILPVCIIESKSHTYVLLVWLIWVSEIQQRHLCISHSH